MKSQGQKQQESPSPRRNVRAEKHRTEPASVRSDTGPGADSTSQMAGLTAVLVVRTGRV